MYRIENVPITRLKEYENNPRNNEVAIDKVAASIRKFGYLFPVIIDINYVIVCGHTRKKACERLGLKFIPCIKVDDLSTEQVRYFRLVDNRTNEYASWDFTKLEEELKLISLESDSNRLMLEIFDLEIEPTEFENEVTEIKVESFNFLNSEPDSSKVQNIGGLGEEYNSRSEDCEETLSNAQNTHKDDAEIHSAAIITDNRGDTTPVSFPTISFFEIGKIQFFISKIELNMLKLPVQSITHAK